MAREKEHLNSARESRIPGSFEEIYQCHFDEIFRYVLHRLGHVADAQDVTAQVFYKAMRHLWRFRWQGRPISAWLFRIANNEVNTYFRKGKRPVTFCSFRDSKSEESLLAEETRNAEQELLQHELFMELRHCLIQLNPEEQALITLRFIEDKPFAEIAAIMGKSTGAVTMRTHRALAKLAERLKKKGWDDEGLRRHHQATARAAT